MKRTTHFLAFLRSRLFRSNPQQTPAPPVCVPPGCVYTPDFQGRRCRRERLRSWRPHRSCPRSMSQARGGATIERAASPPSSDQITAPQSFRHSRARHDGCPDLSPSSALSAGKKRTNRFSSKLVSKAAAQSRVEQVIGTSAFRSGRVLEILPNGCGCAGSKVRAPE
jgi:hypothetical protein